MTRNLDNLPTEQNKLLGIKGQRHGEFKSYRSFSDLSLISKSVEPTTQISYQVLKGKGQSSFFVFEIYTKHGEFKSYRSFSDLSLISKSDEPTTHNKLLGIKGQRVIFVFRFQIYTKHGEFKSYRSFSDLSLISKSVEPTTQISYQVLKGKGQSSFFVFKIYTKHGEFKSYRSFSDLSLISKSVEPTTQQHKICKFLNDQKFGQFATEQNKLLGIKGQRVIFVFRFQNIYQARRIQKLQKLLRFVFDFQKC
eukprot:403366967